MVIQIRGTSGSGKTWIINNLMSNFEFKPVRQKGEVMGYYSSQLNLFIVGKYTTACGGCDTIKTQDEICRRVRKAAFKGWNVLFEGLICSHIAKRYGELYHEVKKSSVKTLFIFLDTPLEKCYKNIALRRKKAGKPPSNPKNTEKDYRTTHRSRENMLAYGVPEKAMPLMSSEQALEYIIKQCKGRSL